MGPETERPVEARWLRPHWRWLFALLTAMVPALVVYTLYHQGHVAMLGFYRDDSAPPVISKVMGGSSAEQAGLQVGDAILAVDGIPFDAGYDRRLGQTYEFEVMRDGQPLTVTVTAGSMLQATRWQLFSAVLVALTFWATGTLLLWRRFQQKHVRLLFLLFQAAAIPLLPGLAYPRFSLPPRWMVFLEFGSFYLAVTLFLHFHLTFPVELGTTRRRRQVLSLLYGLALAVTVDGLSRAAPWTSATAFYVVLVSCIALGMVVYVYARRATPDGRRRLRVVVAGTFLGLTPPLLGYVLPTLVMGYTPDVPRWLVSLFLAVIPLSYLYATVRHNLFGMDRLLNRTLVYVILSLGIFLLCLGPCLAARRYLFDEGLFPAMVVAGMVLVAGLTFDRARTWVQRLIDHLFYGGWYDYPGVVETVCDILARTLEREQLVEVLTRQVPSLMQLQPGHLWVGDQDQRTNLQLPTSNPQFPLTFEDQVHGMWTVGPRHDGEDFSASDRRILHTLARQAETTLSNVLLVERLRRQLDEIREMQHRLLRSREEERARLARDLHDGPIQTLVGLNLQLGLLLAEWSQVRGHTTPAGEVMTAMRAEVRGLLSELRQVCAELRPPMLDTFGLGAALRALAEEWSAQHGVAARLDLPSDVELRSLPEDVAVNFYRVAQEALANIARHASAQQATIRLIWQATRLTLVVHDDGQGFIVPAAVRDLASQGHFGLAGMQERANLVSGDWTLESSPGWGTTVRLVWQEQAARSKEQD
ncbi:MAG: PDZ domain-containing protein [Anaerolineae bacterium]|nr:PDZ domain-containing protein [Anaerolineae bacterium]